LYVQPQLFHNRTARLQKAVLSPSLSFYFLGYSSYLSAGVSESKSWAEVNRLHVDADFCPKRSDQPLTANWSHLLCGTHTSTPVSHSLRFTGLNINHTPCPMRSYPTHSLFAPIMLFLHLPFLYHSRAQLLIHQTSETCLLLGTAPIVHPRHDPPLPTRSHSSPSLASGSSSI